MYRFFRWYNQNRRKIWIMIIAIAIIGFIVFRLFNMMSDSLKKTNNEIYENVNLNEYNSVSVTTQKSIVSGDSVSDLNDDATLIDNFVTYCNLGKIEDAYNLISDECKEKMYENIDKFKNNYYVQVFGDGKKNVNINNWLGDIYKVDYVVDSLTTGKSSKDNVFQDYITITEDKDNNKRLNINKYIRTVELNKTANYEKINVKAIKKDVYFDYEVYTIEIENNSGGDISLGDISNAEFSYLTDKNNYRYGVNINGLAEADLTCVANHTKKVDITFFNQYNSNREIKSLTFSRSSIHYKGEDAITVDKEIIINF